MTQSPADAPLSFGLFHGPHHDKAADPLVLIERDLKLMQHLDSLGYEEAWIGEHHTGAFEMIAAPELFVMQALERTRHIRIGTGVKSLPYHNPFMLAETMAQLDWQARGRAMFGVGPGAMVTDAGMLGIAPNDMRPRMEESLEAIVPLMRGERVTMKTDWFDLDDAKLHLGCFTRPMMEMAVTSVRSPSGVTVAGKHGLGLLTLGGISDNALSKYRQNWEIYEQQCAKFGHVADRSKYRICMFIHLAETREKALSDINWGLKQWIQYTHDAVSAGGVIPLGLDDPVAHMMENQIAIIGTPDDAVREIKRVQEGTGGFGTVLVFGVDWAPPADTFRSFELLAEFVRPHFTGSNRYRMRSYEWAAANQEENIKLVKGAIEKATTDYEKATDIQIQRREEFKDGEKN